MRSLEGRLARLGRRRPIAKPVFTATGRKLTVPRRGARAWPTSCILRAKLYHSPRRVGLARILHYNGHAYLGASQIDLCGERAYTTAHI
jgi:hypothetical protein